MNMHHMSAYHPILRTSKPSNMIHNLWSNAECSVSQSHLSVVFHPVVSFLIILLINVDISVLGKIHLHNLPIKDIIFSHLFGNWIKISFIKDLLYIVEWMTNL